MIAVLRRWFGRNMASAAENGGAVAIYTHPKGTVVMPILRHAAKDGAFRSMYPMLVRHWLVLPPDASGSDSASTLRAAFDRIETYPAGPTYDALIAKSQAEWRDAEPLRQALQLSKSARLWPVMTLLNVRGMGERFVLSPTRALRGGAFEGLQNVDELSVQQSSDDEALGAALQDMKNRCQ